jgi:transcriptional regulator with XRE-family HTH domain
MQGMGHRGELKPQKARDAAAFVALLRQLKEQSGLTYRQLEESAAAHGEVLARSTLSDALRRDVVPSTETLQPFLRACGEGRRIEAWLEARDRIALGASPDDQQGQGRAASDKAAGTEWRGTVRPHLLRLAAVVGTALLLTLIGVAGAAYLPGQTPSATKSSTGRTDTMSRTHAKDCRNLTCRGKDPNEHQCVGDAEMAAGVKTEYGLISLSYSTSCQSLWAEIEPLQDPEVSSIYVKSGKGDVLSIKSDRLFGSPESGRYTPMLPSENLPQHAEVCVYFPKFEACAESSGISRVKPYPLPSQKL